MEMLAPPLKKGENVDSSSVVAIAFSNLKKEFERYAKGRDITEQQFLILKKDNKETYAIWFREQGRMKVAFIENNNLKVDDWLYVQAKEKFSSKRYYNQKTNELSDEKTISIIPKIITLSSGRNISRDNIRKIVEGVSYTINTRVAEKIGLYNTGGYRPNRTAHDVENPRTILLYKNSLEEALFEFLTKTGFRPKSEKDLRKLAEVVTAIVACESTFNPRSRSVSGKHVGYTQIGRIAVAAAKHFPEVGIEPMEAMKKRYDPKHNLLLTLNIMFGLNEENSNFQRTGKTVFPLFGGYQWSVTKRYARNYYKKKFGNEMPYKLIVDHTKKEFSFG